LDLIETDASAGIQRHQFTGTSLFSSSNQLRTTSIRGDDGALNDVCAESTTLMIAPSGAIIELPRGRQRARTRKISHQALPHCCQT
jgi:hypothetical protein